MPTLFGVHFDLGQPMRSGHCRCAAQHRFRADVGATRLPEVNLNVIARRHLACLVAAPLLALTADPALAVDQVHDEIQVYNAAINDVGQWSYEQHLNFAAIGQKRPEFPSGFTSNHSLQGTPEFAYGVTNWWEAGFYLPFAVTGTGEFL